MPARRGASRGRCHGGAWRSGSLPALAPVRRLVGIVTFWLPVLAVVLATILAPLVWVLIKVVALGESWREALRGQEV